MPHDSIPNEPEAKTLLDFSRHWRLDGDYMRCESCGWPQAISEANQAFEHAQWCKADVDARPWRALAVILNRVVCD